MAKHNGCPGYYPRYNGHTEAENREQDRDSVQRAESSTRNGQMSSSTVVNPYYTGRPRTPANGSKHTPIDRQEIIRRIKSGESRPASPELERPGSRSSSKKAKLFAPEQQSKPAENRAKTPELLQDNQAIGAQIARPRSALHKGDFREKEASSSGFERFGENEKEDRASPLATSPGAPWRTDFPAAAFRRFQQAPSTPDARPVRSRGLSSASSLASSFVYKPPTSPLVQTSRPDTPEPPARCSSRNPDKSRRRTFSPQQLQHFGSALEYPASARRNVTAQPPPLRSERTYPYQAHQPRRSLNSFASLPQTPSAASRRPSFSDTPLQHATLVGSYEESILRGRMSTTPSKPLNFVAQIGVLGKGNCKASLRCPPHAQVPFPAVFYCYGSASKAELASAQPSPYVGLVDLENNLPVADPSIDKRRQRVQAALSDEGSRASSRNRGEHSNSDTQNRQRRRQKQKRRSGSPKAPPGGSYRIPQQGQLQIIIKNPNKTAVKLFLIPYDLSDMEPGQKTFIRQRSYSAGPIIDMPLTSRTNLGTDRPEASLSGSDDPNERPTLRYLIHLHICCPSKGRYYLYKSIRVVFANRVPDGKEKLRNEIQLPEPKYSAYKAGRDSNVGLSANTMPKEAARRRSVNEEPASLIGDGSWSQRHPFQAQSLPMTEYNPDSLPLHLQRNILTTLDSRPSSRHIGDNMELDAWNSNGASSNRSDFSPPNLINGDSPPISKGVRELGEAFNFDRDRSRERKPGQRSESLLSRRLKDLAFQRQQREV